MVSYYHQVYPLTALRELVLTLPWCRTITKCSHPHSHTVFSLTHTPMVSYYHQVITHPHQSLCSHSHSHGVVLPPSLLTHCSERTCAPTHTSMVSYYHQVYPLTALRELVLTLPWCRTITKCSLTLTLTLSSLSHTLPWCRTTTKSSHTHTNPCAPTHSHLPCPHTLCSPLISFHLILTTNSSQLISHTLPPIMPPSHHHHLITSSYHQPPPIASSHSTQHS